MGTVTPIGIALSEMPAIMASASSGSALARPRAALIIEFPRPMVKRSERALFISTASCAAPILGSPCDWANDPLYISSRVREMRTGTRWWHCRVDSLQ
jgi:hypothetical protein